MTSTADQRWVSVVLCAAWLLRCRRALLILGHHFTRAQEGDPTIDGSAQLGYSAGSFAGHLTVSGMESRQTPAPPAQKSPKISVETKWHSGLRLSLPAEGTACCLAALANFS